MKIKLRTTSLISIGLLAVSFLASKQALAESKVLTKTEDALLKTYSDAGKKLAKDKVLSGSEIAAILENKLTVKPSFYQQKGTYILGTGDNGSVNGIVVNGNYVVTAPARDGLDISVPAQVTITGEKTIPVGLAEGTGLVKKLASVKQNYVASLLARIFKPLTIPVYAADTSSKVTVTTYFDKNGNGNWDRDERAIPWAGISVRLQTEAVTTAQQKAFQSSSSATGSSGAAGSARGEVDPVIQDVNGQPIDFGKVQIGTK